MTPAVCSFLRLSKTYLIRVVAAGASIVIAVASLTPQSLAIGNGFGDKLNLRSYRLFGCLSPFWSAGPLHQVAHPWTSIFRLAACAAVSMATVTASGAA
jgi:hypothetical protein